MWDSTYGKEQVVALLKVEKTNFEHIHQLFTIENSVVSSIERTFPKAALQNVGRHQVGVRYLCTGLHFHTHLDARFLTRNGWKEDCRGNLKEISYGL